MNLFKFLNSNHLLGLSYGSVGVGAAPPNEGCSADASTGDYLGLPVEMLSVNRKDPRVGATYAKAGD
jgi:hypothetical protein